MEVTMKVILKQTTDKGLVIPPEYLPEANEFELEVTNESIIVRPNKEDEPLSDVYKRYPWIGIAHSNNPNASMEVEEILFAEVHRRAGFTHDPYPEDDPL